MTHVLTALALVAVVAVVRLLSRRRPRWFTHLPAPFWCYAAPMIVGSMGWLPHHSPVYTMLARYALPACLALLLVGTDLRAIVGLGPVALGVMAAGTIGIMLGGPLALAVFQRWLPPDAWMGVGALSGSWIGGSANMLAVREALGAPEHVFTPMIVVDTVCAYAWMAGLIALAGWQPQMDRWLGAREIWLRRLHSASQSQTLSARARSSGWLAAAVGASGLGCVWIARWLPPIGAAITRNTWAVLLATAVGLSWSLSARLRRQAAIASDCGTALLYLLLASIGASADVRSLFQAPVWLLVGVCWLLIHGAVLLLVGRLGRVPIFFLVTASQANVGGTASAPLVASVYQSELAVAGLLLAVVGNIAGTCLGLVTAWLCRWVAMAYGLA